MKKFHLNEESSKWLREENKKQKEPFALGWSHYSQKENLIQNEHQTFYLASTNPNREDVKNIVDSVVRHLEEHYTIKVIKSFERELKDDEVEELGYQDYLASIYLASIYKGKHFVGVLTVYEDNLTVRFFDDGGADDHFEKWNHFDKENKDWESIQKMIKENLDYA